MMKLGAWLAALMPGLAGRVLVALGFSIVTFTGFTVSVGLAKDSIIANIQGAPSAIVSLMSLAGVGHGLGMIFGAVTFRLAYWQLSQSTKLVIK